MSKNKNKHEHETLVCSICQEPIEIKTPYDMPIYDPNSGFGVCKNCITRIASIINDHEKTNAKGYIDADFLETITEVLSKNKPHVIKEFLDQYIINQYRAKKTLSVAVYNHFKRMKYGATHGPKDMNLDKSNVIMLGPSGCGKTAILQSLAKLLDIPFSVTDASSLTEAGFVGSDVEVAVRNLYYAADQDIARTQHGIIYLDEFDKIARKSGENNSITADPGHEGVQQGLLKMIEGGVVEFTAQGQRKHPEAPTTKVDTTNILFIVGGAFVGIEKIIAKRLKHDGSSIGFGAKVTTKEEEPKYNDLIRQVRPDDLMKFGIIPEIIGRLPVICTLEELSKDDLLRILTEPKNAPIKQYKELLAMDNVDIEFEKDALYAVAEKAIERKTGARGLKGILEDVMLDVMYDLPKSQEPRKVTVTKECITEHAQPKIEILKN